jgi:hypothetical protein
MNILNQQGQHVGTLGDDMKLDTTDPDLRQLYDQMLKDGLKVRGPGKLMTAQKRSDSEQTLKVSKQTLGILCLELGRHGYLSE